MKIGLVFFVILASILNTVQSGSNAALNKAFERPFWAAICISAIGLTTVLAVALVSGQRWPSGEVFSRTPWWAWIGGVFGAVYVLSIVLAADKLGAAVFTSLTVTVAVITSLVMDHFGLMGFQQHPAGVARIGGGILMIAGLALIARF